MGTMTGRGAWLAALFLLGAAAAMLTFTGEAESATAAEERLSRYRTLGKAFYENPTTQAQAVEQFRLALKLNPKSNVERLNYGLALLRAGKGADGIAELEAVQKADPKMPQTWFNLGIEFKKQGETEKAVAQLEEMGRLVPDEPITQYNLGVLYKLLGRTADSLAKFQLASQLDPNLAAAHFQLFNAYRQAGRSADAQKELQVFQEIKKQQEASGNTEDVDWSVYSEVYDVIDEKLSNENTAGPALRFVALKLPGSADAATAEVTVLDVNGDGAPDVMVASKSGIAVYSRGATKLDAGLADVSGIRAVAAGDYDNDGLPDLCIVTDSGVAIYHNAKGRFVKADIPVPGGAFQTAAWLDYDHDYDLDLVLLGSTGVLLRNQGEAGFVDRSADFPFQTGDAVEAVNYRLIPDSKALDLVVSYDSKPPVLYRDRLGGRYEAQPLVTLPGGVRGWRVADINNDSYLDLAFRTGGGAYVALNRSGKVATPQPLGSAGSGFVLGDWENRGLLDFLQGGQRSRNLGSARFEPARAVTSLPAAAAWAAADFDGDGRLDLVGVLPDGSVQRWNNRTVLASRWLRVGLTGIKNLKLAPGSEVEVKAGALYQKKVYAGVPLLFGLRGMTQAETVRITWPNGLIQNEVRQLTAKSYSYKEAQRLSGSCPVIWTWDGKEFRYVTDVLGVAPLGAASGDGQYFPTDHDEYIMLPAGALQQRGGHFEIRVTEELSEVTYLDQVELLAIDHPADSEVFLNEKWKAPPFPDFRLFGAARRVYPVKATDERGRDVTDRVLRKDERAVDTFQQNLNGVAAPHELVLDFGKAAAANKAVLILSGWVDWADGSTFLSQAQESPDGLQPPRLQVKDSAGRWVTVVEDMGMPDGKPKTITVDLTGKFLSASREVRILTNLCVFWDEIFLSEDSGMPRAQLSRLVPDQADLRFRGFSHTIIDARRKQPERFVYAQPAATSLWNPTPGMYTRYGEVSELLRTVDDRLMIMGSGDEVRILYDARQLPALRPGWVRDFALHVDGWAKDRDANTAFSQSVGPLPFHAMSSYPYPSDERFPETAEHQRYLKEYNTRPALRLLRPLHTAGTASRTQP